MSDQTPTARPSVCHRCGGPNLTWWVDSALWNEAIRNTDGTVRDGYPGSEIICPQCFTTAYEALSGGPEAYAVWELRLDIGTGRAALGSGSEPEEGTP